MKDYEMMIITAKEEEKSKVKGEEPSPSPLLSHIAPLIPFICQTLKLRNTGVKPARL